MAMHILFFLFVTQLTLFILYAAVPEWYQLTEPVRIRFFISAAPSALGQQVFIKKEHTALHMLVLF